MDRTAKAYHRARGDRILMLGSHEVCVTADNSAATAGRCATSNVVDTAR